MDSFRVLVYRRMVWSAVAGGGETEDAESAVCRSKLMRSDDGELGIDCISDE